MPLFASLCSQDSINTIVVGPSTDGCPSMESSAPDCEDPIYLKLFFNQACLMQEPTLLSLTGAVLICVSTFSLGAFEKTHPKPSSSPDPSLRGANNIIVQDGFGQYEQVPNGPARPS